MEIKLFILTNDNYIEYITSIVKWANENDGFIGLLIFAITLSWATFSGAISAVLRKPKLKISLLSGPSFYGIFKTSDNLLDGHPVHRTAFALYLRVSNIGYGPQEIHNIRLGFKERTSFKFGWCWLADLGVALDDFQVAIGESVKLYPFLVQKNAVSGESARTYLLEGQSTNGESWLGKFGQVL